MGCTSLRKGPDGSVPIGQGGVPGQIEVAEAPLVTTYQNNQGSHVLGNTRMQVSSMHHVPQSYNPIRAGQTNNQFLSADILGAQSKIVPPQPPIYSPTPQPSHPAIASVPQMQHSSFSNPNQFRIPMGPSTQDFYEHKYRRR